MTDEGLLNLAMSMRANPPGTYALLIGSGVSRGAGIPTGWDVVVDLIQQLAAATNENTTPDPGTWYEKKFGESPDYDKILRKLAQTPAERMNLLRRYFEPTNDEEKAGSKVPAAGHRVIANLARSGHIRMIITTNFDRLIEKALGDEDIVPDVIRSDSAEDLKAAIPYTHSKCFLVKLHGDYRDTRLKNTPEELSTYSTEMNGLLDRIFDEFGLIICGWSAQYDTALRKALLRCASHRFTTYWLTKGEPKEEAKEIIQRRRAEVIPIESADQSFTQLQGKIQSLSELERRQPPSAPAVIATVKQYLTESRYRIPLEDLLSKETARVWGELCSEQFEVHSMPNKESFQQRMQQYESLVEVLKLMLAAVSYYDRGENSSLITRSIERLIPSSREGGGDQFWLDFQLYPALLIMYAAGISAIASNNFGSLAAALRDPKYRCYRTGEKRRAVETLNAASVFKDASKWVPGENDKRRPFPISHYLFDLLRPALRDYLPDDQGYEESFDVFEYLLSVTYVDNFADRYWSGAPLGRFAYRYRRFFAWDEESWESSPMGEFVRSGLEQGANWGLLKAGFFGGSVERCKEIVKIHKEWLQGMPRT